MAGRERRWVFTALTIILLALAGTLIARQATLAILIALTVILVPLGLAWRFAPIPKNARRLTWNQSVVIILATIILGNALVALWPLWLAPPRLGYTLLIYLILAVTWYPVTLICVLMRPTGRDSFAALLFLVMFGGVVCLIALALAGPNVGLVFFVTPDCPQEVVAPGLYRYTCQEEGFLAAPDQVVFEGPTWSPFVRLVSWKRINYAG